MDGERGWVELAAAMMDAVKEHGESHAELLGCGNHQDMRLLYLIAGLARKKKTLTEPQMARLGAALTRFLEDLDSEERYFLPCSGSYWLKIERSGLEALATGLLQGNIDPMMLLNLKDSPYVVAEDARWKAAAAEEQARGDPARLVFLGGLAAAATYCVWGRLAA